MAKNEPATVGYGSGAPDTLGRGLAGPALYLNIIASVSGTPHKLYGPWLIRTDFVKHPCLKCSIMETCLRACIGKTVELSVDVNCYDECYSEYVAPSSY